MRVLVVTRFHFPGQTATVASQVTGPESHRERVGTDGPRAQRGAESPGPAAAGGGAVGGRQAQVGGAPCKARLLSETGSLDAVPPAGVCGSCRRPHQLLEVKLS